MATRMQQRRGTAAQWISTNAGAGPVLNAGEMGWESDTNKFKIGDGVNNWTSLDYFADINSTVDPAFGSSITFEGATANAFETTLTVTDPTADRTITIPDVTGTVITTGNLSDITNIGVFTSTITMEGSTANDFELTLSAGDPTADRTLTFPDATDTLVGKATTDTLTNKSISLGSNTVTSTLAQLNTAISDADVASLAGSETLTNKTIALGSNTVSGTLAQFNTAVTDADFATLAGTETLTNKTLTTPVISSITNGAATLTLPTSTGTIALTTDIPSGVVTETGTQTLTNKTLTSPTLTTPNIGVASGTSLTLTGDLIVQGTTTTIDSTTIAVKTAFVFEGATNNEFETTLTLVDPTADRTLTLPDATDTLVGRATTDTLTNKTLGSAVATTALTLNATAELRLADTDSSHYVGFKAPGTVTTNKIWTLPDADGTANQVLKTDGSGTLSWATAGGGGAAFSELMLIGA